MQKKRGRITTILIILCCFTIATVCESNIMSNQLKTNHKVDEYVSFKEGVGAEVDVEDAEIDPEDQAQLHENEEGASGIQGHGEEQGEQHSGHRLVPSDVQFWQNLLLCLFLTVCGAFCSGMGVGLLSISKLQLNMMKQKSNALQKKMAERILKVVNDHHLFLVTLLIANAMALESLPLVMHTLMPDWLAILFSTCIVLVFAQIVPQAFCTGPNKIKIAYYASPIILVMIKIFYILSMPIGKLLDYLVGAEHDEKIQHKDFGTFLNEDKFLNKTQKLLLTSTLDLRGDRVRDVMIDVKNFFMVEENEMIGEKKVQEMIENDFSYVLVYKENRDSIIGTIKVKEFAIKYLKTSANQMRAGDVMRHTTEKMLTVYQDTNLLEMLMLFQAKSTRFALVVKACRKIDKNILSIMYTKNDMIYKEKDGEVIGVVFLYHIFNEMAEIQDKKIKQGNQIIEKREGEPRRANNQIEMDNLDSRLMREI